MITTDRYLLETQVFAQERYPVEAYRFFDLGTNKPYVKMAAKTNSGNIYTLRVDLDKFPEQIPPVYVTKMLKDKNGYDMSSSSAAYHTLNSHDGMTRICHYGPRSWTPRISLFKIMIRCRLWLEAYEAHLVTGNTIDFYLKHQQ